MAAIKKLKPHEDGAAHGQPTVLYIGNKLCADATKTSQGRRGHGRQPAGDGSIRLLVGVPPENLLPFLWWLVRKHRQGHSINWWSHGLLGNGPFCSGLLGSWFARSPCGSGHVFGRHARGSHEQGNNKAETDRPLPLDGQNGYGT